MAFQTQKRRGTGKTQQPESDRQPGSAFATARQTNAAPPGLALDRRLGVGGMGTVYLAKDAETQRFVAVKLLHAPGDVAAFDRFQAEVRALAELNHPHIVTVFAASTPALRPRFTRWGS